MTTTDPVTAGAPSPQTVPQFLRMRATRSPTSIAQWSLDSDGKWTGVRWDEVERRVAKLSILLRAHGLEPGQRVGIIAPSCAQWDWLQMAVLGARGVVVGLDPHDVGTRLSIIATQADVSMLIAATPDLLQKFTEAARRKFGLVVLLRGDAEVVDARHVTLQQLLDAPAVDDSAWDASKPDDMATIIFTSGTTGAPKGIMHTHRQLCLAADSLLEAFADIREGSRLACWLPLSNLFQRMVNICAIGRGAQTFYVENPREIMDRVAEINPHIFIGVPRFYEKLYRGIMQRIESAPRWKRVVARWALSTGEIAARARSSRTPPGAGAGLRLRIARLLVLDRLRHVMGSNLLYMISGSAPMPAWLLQRFDAMGLMILEAYGLSENTVPIAANRPDQRRSGSVGIVFAANTVRFDDDGEILVRGEGLFDGYLASDDAAARFTPDGFYRTGDLGHVDRDGFLFVSGRRSDGFKSSHGRWLAPAQIEAAYTRIPYVDQIVVVGRGRPYPAALLSIDMAAFVAQLRDASPTGTGSHPAPVDVEAIAGARSRIAADLEAAGQDLTIHERVRRFELLPRPLGFETDELTPSLKLKRAVIEQKYAALIDRMYEASA